MPFEILAGPVLICFVIGIFMGLKQGQEQDDTNL